MAKNEVGTSTGLDLDLLSDALARVEDLSELKVILHVMRLAALSGSPGIRLTDLDSPAVVRSVAGFGSPEPGEERVRRSLERALANGYLLRVTITDGDERDVHLLPATATNKVLVARLRSGDSGADEQLGLPNQGNIGVYRPNIFALYEHQIGPLTPLIAEQLRDAERSYPRAWVEEAIRVAADYNKRNWRYVQTLLSRWEERESPADCDRRNR